MKMLNLLSRYIYKKFFRNAIQNEIELFLQHKHLVFGPPERLSLHASSIVLNARFNTTGGKIIVEAEAFFGHSVTILTGTHDYYQFGEARKSAHPDNGRDVIIGRGAWIGTGAIIIGPCTIGENSVIGAGAVVTKNVESFTVVGGVPARTIKVIENHIEQ
jgi:acetyltransferase-like isoleucine patch superfamily enzyme